MLKFLLMLVCFSLLGCAVDASQSERISSSSSAVCTCGEGNAIPSGSCYSTCMKTACYPYAGVEGLIYYNFDTDLQECRQAGDGDYCDNGFKCMPGLQCVPYYDQGYGEGACNADCSPGLMCGSTNYWLDPTTVAAHVSYCLTYHCNPASMDMHSHCVQTAQNKFHYACY